MASLKTQVKCGVAATLVVALAVALAGCPSSPCEPTGCVAANDAGNHRQDARVAADADVPLACSIVGPFIKTQTDGGEHLLTLSGDETSGSFVLTVTYPTHVIRIDGGYSRNGRALSMTNASASPGNVHACIAAVVVYELTWTSDCKQVSFAKLTEECSGRVGDETGTTLTRQ